MPDAGVSKFCLKYSDYDVKDHRQRKVAICSVMNREHCGLGPSDVTRSRDIKKHVGWVNDLVTSHVNKDGGRTCLRRSRGVNTYGG